MKLAGTCRGLLCGLFFAALPLAAFADTATTFTVTLTEENKTATGLNRLTEPQLASLDAQIAQEISVARQGKTPAFSTSFTRRRSPQQRKEAGLDQLMTPELKRLDELVAAAVADTAKPVATGPIIATPATTTPASPSDWVEVTPRKMEVHGEVTLAYMWGSGGRSGYGAELATTMTDPSGKFSVTFIVSQFQFTGKGPHRPSEYGCDRGW